MCFAGFLFEGVRSLVLVSFGFVMEEPKGEIVSSKGRAFHLVGTFMTKTHITKTHIILYFRVSVLGCGKESHTLYFFFSFPYECGSC
jgi:hypothetical protein